MKSLRSLSMVWVVLVGALGAAAAAQAAGPTAEQFVLSGVVLFDDTGGGLAWLQEPTLTQNRVLTLRRGDSVGPWKLTRILATAVELEGPGGTILVPLQNAGGGDAPARAAGPSPTRAPGAQPETKAGGSTTAGAHPRPDPARSQAQAPRTAQGPGAGPADPQIAPEPPPQTIHIPVGDPRRRESIKQLFGGALQ